MAGELDQIVQRLSYVSYYRLSGYWHPFRFDENGVLLADSRFREGTTFEAVWARYAFDRRLRVLVMDAIERFEIAFRTWLAYEHAHAHGPFSYAEDPATLSGLIDKDRRRLLSELAEEMRDSKETFVDHFKAKYGDEHEWMPIWMVSETMTLGQSAVFFRGVSAKIKQSVAWRLQVHDKVLQSWVSRLNTVRNICAHHGRLWNRGFGTDILIPTSQPAWMAPIRVANEQMFGVLTILQYCLSQIAPQSKWRDRFTAIVAEFNTVPLKFMGFPDNWQTCPIWGDGYTPPASPAVTRSKPSKASGGPLAAFVKKT